MLIYACALHILRSSQSELKVISTVCVIFGPIMVLAKIIDTLIALLMKAAER